MITSLLLTPIIALITWLISFFPSIQLGNVLTGDMLSMFTNVVSFVSFVLPLGYILTFLRLQLFWWGILLAWTAIEWIYHKIPGVS